MKLLFDQNLSHKLVARLADLFPGSLQIKSIKMQESPDHDIWSFARDRDYCIVSQDNDFQQLSRSRGAPPKVLWLRLGNSSVNHIELVLRTHFDDLIEFDDDDGSTILIIE